MSKDNKNRLIMRHVLEIRLKRRVFSFLDFKGELSDFLLKELKRDKIRISNDGIRIDVANDDLTNVWFISYENFGFQIDGSKTFDNLTQETEKILNIINSFPKYKFDSIIRIGVRSLILYHCKGDNFDGLKQKYKDSLYTNYKDIENNTNTELSDVASCFEFKKGSATINITTGPVTKEEAIKKYFGKNKCYEDFNVNNGFFFDIDYFKNGEKEMVNINLKEEIVENIKNTEEILKGFLSYFKSDNNYE